MITIDKELPIPMKSGRGGKKYPFEQMEVGDSFECDTPQSSLSSAVYGFVLRRQPTWKFRTQKVSETTTRIWRIA